MNMKKIFALSTLLFCMFFLGMASNTLNINVKGMHCGGCETKFKSKAQAIDGVSAVKEVSAEKSMAVLEYNPAVISESEIIKQLTAQTGYEIANIDAGKTTEATTKSCCKSGQTSCNNKTASTSCDKKPASNSNTTKSKNKK
jgi:copper chaperone CopZ